MVTSGHVGKGRDKARFKFRGHVGKVTRGQGVVSGRDAVVPLANN